MNKLFSFSQSPLFFCVENSAIVELLLRKGADPNLVDEGGNCALFYACSGASDRVDEASIEKVNIIWMFPIKKLIILANSCD